jgi:glucose-6-phosphate isomerase
MQYFAKYLQQADMESNGKSTQYAGEQVPWNTAPVIWGEPGTDSQHSFFQMLHQGTSMIPCDFISFAQAPDFGEEFAEQIADHHAKLLANFFAQTQALMQGKSAKEVRNELEKQGKSEKEIIALLPHKVFKGNKPSTTILCKALTPTTLGSLIALYEHKIFVQGVIWNVNSFDQWGVELGKQLAKPILQYLTDSNGTPSFDASTNGLLRQLKL